METALNSTKIEVRISMGFTKMLIGDLTRLHRGSMVEFSSFSGCDVRLFVKDKCIGSAKIVITKNGSTKKLSVEMLKIH